MVEKEVKEIETIEEDKSDTVESTPMLDEAKKVAEEIKQGNDERRTLLDREEALMAKKALGGVAEAGKEPEEPKEQSPQEYAKEEISLHNRSL